jgi:hypothetical protein
MLIEKGDPHEMSALKRLMPFNAEQAVNILSEFGPLVLMFVVNAMWGIAAGTWALIISTVIAIVAMLLVLRRLPIFPLIASTVTVVFGGLTIITHDPMWVQIKVTIFNALFAAFLFGGLWFDRNFFKYVFEKTFHYSKEGWDNSRRAWSQRRARAPRWRTSAGHRRALWNASKTRRRASARPISVSVGRPSGRIRGAGWIWPTRQRPSRKRRRRERARSC